MRSRVPVRLLIATQCGDAHAKAVNRALQSCGHSVHLWYATDHPQRAVASLRLTESSHFAIDLKGPNGPTAGPFDRFWLRRPTLARLPSDMHPGDVEFAEGEWRMFLQGMRSVVAPGAFFVNPPQSASRAESKALQLSAAMRAGFVVPPTLMSNDPQQIRDFIVSNPGETIYKPFRSPTWTANHHVSMAYTATVTLKDLPDDDILRLTPGIFQPRIDKAWELRVTVIGESLFAARLDSQAHPGALVDWRSAIKELPVTVDHLPRAVEQQCHALMRDLGLVYGCIDLIVKPDGAFVFLEVNQSGQFLWLELMNPELPLLDAFCHMLIEGRADHGWRPEQRRFWVSDFHDATLNHQEDLLHVERSTRAYPDELPETEVTDESAG